MFNNDVILPHEVKEEYVEDVFIDSTQKSFDPGLLFQSDLGIYGFTILLDHFATPKNRWMFSSKLGKLFIVWDQVIPLEFKWIPGEPNLFVRAVATYTEPQHVMTPVLRCKIHADKHDPTNEGINFIHHVVRSDNPGAIYDTDPSTGFASVLVPLGELQPGTGTVTVTYRFMCKSSCTTGMMRRPIAVTFNLERANGVVLGRQSIAVKICSCPRRDMEKEEEIMRQQNRKAVKREQGSRHVFQFDVGFKNKEAFIKILEFNHGITTSLLRGLAADHRSTQELTEFLKMIEEKLYLTMVSNGTLHNSSGLCNNFATN